MSVKHVWAFAINAVKTGRQTEAIAITRGHRLASRRGEKDTRRVHDLCPSHPGFTSFLLDVRARRLAAARKKNKKKKQAS